MHSWRVLLLPFLGERELYEKYDFSQPWNSEANLRLAASMPRTYAFHGEYHPGLTTTNYLAVVGESTVWPGASQRKPDEITDSTASTILLIENTGANVHWMEPRDFHIESMSLQVNDPNGISSKYRAPAVTMVDSSMRTLENGFPADVLRAMLTATGGEQVTPVGESWRLLHDGRARSERAVKTD